MPHTTLLEPEFCAANVLLDGNNAVAPEGHETLLHRFSRGMERVPVFSATRSFSIDTQNARGGGGGGLLAHSVRIFQEAFNTSSHVSGGHFRQQCGKQPSARAPTRCQIQHAAFFRIFLPDDCTRCPAVATPVGPASE